MSETLVLADGIVVTPFRSLPADVAVKEGRVSEIRPPGLRHEGEKRIDCAGLYVGPGLVDIHVHGGGGCDFASDDPAAIAAGAEYHLRQGTTSLTPSSLSIPFAQADRAIAAARQAAKQCQANILGYHVEGVYLDMEYRGGHLAQYVHDPDPREYQPLLEKHGDFITQWTLAPELPGALELIESCRRAGVVVSAGHTRASYEQFLSAIEAGLTHTTHYCCCMGNMRFEVLQPELTTGKGFAPGVLEAVLLHDEVTTELICDGFHLHPAFVQLAVKCKGPAKVCLISDAVFGVGMPEGEIVVGDQPTIMKNGIAIIRDRPDIIASSVTPLSGMLRFAHQQAGIPLAAAWEMASATPARVIGVDQHKGVLGVGKDADILLLDRGLNVRGVYVGGRRA
jgi:N-acetylglucosamine-6-phosphate deacetylase